jgi:hypothetical protein
MPEIVHTDTGRQSKDPAEGTYFLCASHTQAEQPHTSSVHVLEDRGVRGSSYRVAVRMRCSGQLPKQKHIRYLHPTVLVTGKEPLR